MKINFLLIFAILLNILVIVIASNPISLFFGIVGFSIAVSFLILKNL